MAKHRFGRVYGVRFILSPAVVCGLALVLGTVSVSSYGATYYRWVDKEGITHYTSAPPQGIPSEKVSMGAGSSPYPATAPETAPARETTNPSSPPTVSQQEAQLKDEQLCQAAQDRMKTLDSGRRLRVPTDDGGFRYLSEEDLAEERAVTQRAIDQSCQ
jgi:hypothetical protein